MTTVDERYLRIIKAMAYGHLAYDDTSQWCLHCDGTEVWSEARRITEFIHRDNCPVLLARQIMWELGTPLCEYRVTFEQYSRYSKQWTEITVSVTAYTEQGAIADYPAIDNLRRNVQAHIVQDVQP